MNRRQTHELFAWWLDNRGFNPSVMKTRMRFKDDTMCRTWIELWVLTSKKVMLYRKDDEGKIQDSFQADNWTLTAEGLAFADERGETRWILPKERVWE